MANDNSEIMEEVTFRRTVDFGGSDADLLFGSGSAPVNEPKPSKAQQHIASLLRGVEDLNKEIEETVEALEKKSPDQDEESPDTFVQAPESDSDEEEQYVTDPDEEDGDQGETGDQGESPVKKKKRMTQTKERQEKIVVAKFKREQKKNNILKHTRHLSEHKEEDEFKNVVLIRKQGAQIPHRLNQNPAIQADEFVNSKRNITRDNDLSEDDDFDLVIVQNLNGGTQQTENSEVKAPTAVEDPLVDGIEDEDLLSPQQASAQQKDGSVAPPNQSETVSRLYSEITKEENQLNEENQLKEEEEENQPWLVEEDSDESSMYSDDSSEGRGRLQARRPMEPLTKQESLNLIKNSMQKLGGRTGEILKMSLAQQSMDDQHHIISPTKQAECHFFNQDDEESELSERERIRERVEKLDEQQRRRQKAERFEISLPVRKSKKVLGKRQRASFLTDPDGKKIAKEFSLSYKRQKMSGGASLRFRMANE